MKQNTNKGSETEETRKEGLFKITNPLSETESRLIFKVTNYNEVTNRAYIMPINLNMPIPPSTLISFSELTKIS